MVKIKKFRAECLIDNDEPPKDDLTFIRRKGLKPTALLRVKIKELREEEENPTTPLKEVVERLRIQNNKLLVFLEKNNLTDDFFKSK
jgi:hypothetical protein